MLRCIAATATHKIHQSISSIFPGMSCHVAGQKVKPGGCQRIREPGIGISGNKEVHLGRQLGQAWTHLVRTKGTVQSNRQWVHMPECIGKSLHLQG